MLVARHRYVHRDLDDLVAADAFPCGDVLPFLASEVSRPTAFRWNLQQSAAIDGRPLIFAPKAVSSGATGTVKEIMSLP